ncbi:MAG: STAS domain-containing protein [Gemmatimonadales bacterium]
MRISAVHDGPVAVVHLTGRLDGESARHLSDTIEDLLREGARSIELDLSAVDYLSSAGIRVLSRRAEDLSTLRGSLHVVMPSEIAREALNFAGLGSSLIREGSATRVSGSAGRFTHWGMQAVNAQHGTYEASHYTDAGVTCRLYGTGASPLRGPIDPAHCRTVPFPPGSFGLGIGAIADRYEDAAPRFGELVAAEGIVAYLPTDGARTPDFMLNYAGRAPQAVIADGITWQGLFTDLIRFTTQPSSDQLPLAELAEMCVQMTGKDAVVLATVAEVSGIVGASLRHSPALLPEGFAYEPGASKLREWVSFTPEPTHQGSTALILGVAARHPSASLAPYLRPLDNSGTLHGHLHAVIFPYTPVPQRTVMLPALIGRLFQTLGLRDILHLIHDGRGLAGAGQTGLLRGVCWTAPIIATEVMT